MKVEPFIKLKDVRSIKKLLANNLRDRLLFILGINAGLRVQDLLALKVKDVSDLKVGARISLIEKKTNKENVLIINKDIKEALDAYLESAVHDEQHHLFKSRKGKNYPITTFAVTKYVKQWAEAINLKGNYGAHTLRKTWCYHQRKTFGVSWELISKRCNHSSPSITRRYLGIQEGEVEKILLNTI